MKSVLSWEFFAQLVEFVAVFVVVCIFLSPAKVAALICKSTKLLYAGDFLLLSSGRGACFPQNARILVSQNMGRQRMGK